MLSELLGQDLRHLARLEPPTTTWTIAKAGITAARSLRRGTITTERLEKAVADMLIRRSHRKRYGRRVVIPMLDELSLALDIDTEEEARELGGDVQSA
jgi:hypothetical protein